MSELYGIVSLGGTVIGASLNQRGLKGETGATGATGNGIASISKTGSSGLIDTYTITYTNGNTATFTVTNGQDGHSPIITASKSGKTTSVFLDGTKIAEIDDGVGIDSIYKTGSSGLDPVVDEYTILYDDGNYTTFTVTNGKKGDKGDPQSPYTSTPNMDGVGSAGSSSNYSRGDHVHPSDTTKVDKVAGKGLSENDFTDSLKTKLDGIASGAEVNVQSDWNQSTNTADDYIKNKPDLSVYAPLASPSLTGTPTAPTATEGTNTTQIATTAFVKTADDAVKGMLKDALPTDTASGAIASFPDGSDLFDCLSCVVDIDPIQDLHGYDAPWVGGAGNNKWDEVAYSNGVRLIGTNPIPLVAGKTYYVSAPKAVYIYANGSNLFAGKNNTFIVPSGVTEGQIQFDASYGLVYNHDVSINYPATVTSYRPYSNICPISGHDDVDVVHTGVNVWDEEWRNGYFNTNGVFVANSSYFASKNYIKVLPNTTYNFHCESKNIGRLCFYDLNEMCITTQIYTSSATDFTFTTQNNCYYMQFDMVGAYGTTYNNDISINYPSTDHDYHAYNGQTYTTALPETVYGGTLDLVSGVLTVDRAKETYEWADGAGATTLGAFTRKVFKTAYASVRQYTGDNIQVCNCLPWKHDYLDQSAHFYVDTGNAGSNNCVVVMPSEITSQTITIVYGLAQAQTYQLTPQQIDTLKGQNNVWADCGNVEVQYKADVQMYIEKHITVYNGGVS